MIERKFQWICAILLVCGQTPAFADEALDELMRKPEYRGVHDGMEEQKATLVAIQEGFIANDMDAIQHSANKLAKSMHFVSQGLPEQTGEAGPPEAWKAMYQIVEDAKTLKEDAARGDYPKAYERYSAIIGQCVRCHNLTQPPPEPEEVEEIEE